MLKKCICVSVTATPSMRACSRSSITTAWINKCVSQSNPCAPKITLEGVLNRQREKGSQKCTSHHSYHPDSSPALHGYQHLLNRLIGISHRYSLLAYFCCISFYPPPLSSNTTLPDDPSYIESLHSHPPASSLNTLQSILHTSARVASKRV